MTQKDLRAAAIECLYKAFTGENVPVHIVQAATAIVLTDSGRVPR